MSDLVAFIHVALLPRCQERIDQYLSLMKKSGLLDSVHHVYIDCIGKGELPNISEYVSYPITVQRLSENLEENEFVSQHHLWTYANEHPTSFILYLHTKGVGKEVNPAIEDWVAYMIYFLIGKWQLCRQVLFTYKTVGVDLRQEFHLHYSGNFWWTRSNHIRELPDPLLFKDLSKYPNALESWRHNAEFWICSDNDPRTHANLWSSNIPVNERHKYAYPSFLYQKD